MVFKAQFGPGVDRKRRTLKRSLVEVLKTMSANVYEDRIMSVSYIRGKVDYDGNVLDESLRVSNTF